MERATPAIEDLPEHDDAVFAKCCLASWLPPLEFDVASPLPAIDWCRLWTLPLPLLCAALSGAVWASVAGLQVVHVAEHVCA